MKYECERAVILAAGKGVRARSLATEKPKCLMEIKGKPIIMWITKALAEAGIREVIVVTGFKANILKQTLGDGSHQNLNLWYVHNPNWTQPNGLSLYTVRDTMGKQETFLTLMSDHLLPPCIIREVRQVHTSKCVLAVDTDIPNVFDLSDATKVRIVNEKPVAIGKRLKTYNAVDCGLFRFDGRIFTALETAFSRGRRALTDGVKMLIADSDLHVLPVRDKMFWIDIDTPQAYRQALNKIDMFLSMFSRDSRDWLC